jgi:hypothetical protein
MLVYKELKIVLYFSTVAYVDTELPEALKLFYISIKIIK